MDWSIVVHLYSLMLIMAVMFIPIIAILVMSRGIVKTTRFAVRRPNRR